MATTTFTTEQTLPFTFDVTDGRGRRVAVDVSNGPPVAASSDETIATVTIEAADASNTLFNGVVTSVTPSPDGTTQRITITADADLGAGVQDVVGFFDIVVTLDPRTGQRIAEVTPGAPVDKPVTP